MEETNSSQEELLEAIKEEYHKNYLKGRIDGYVECQVRVLKRMLNDNVPLETALGYVNMRMETYKKCFTNDE